MPGRPPANVAIKLVQLQQTGRCPKLYCQVPPRLQSRIEELLDEEEQLKSCVLLGFSRCGNYLVSYTSAPVAAADGIDGHCLQLWSFERGVCCRKLWNVPLFKARGLLDGSQQEEDEFESATDAQLFVTVVETPGSELFVVHGRPIEGYDLDDRIEHHLTAIPGPCYASSQQLQVVHLSYPVAPPHTLFNPYTSLLLQPTPATSRGVDTSVVIACNLGDGLRMLTLTVSASATAATAMEQLRAEVNLRVETVTRCSSRPPVLHISGSHGSGPPPQRSSSHSCRAAGFTRVAASALPAGQALDWEEFMYDAVRQQGLPLQSLRDYEVAVAMPGTLEGKAGLLAVAMLWLRAPGEPSGNDDGGGGADVLCLVVFVAAGVAEVVEVLKPPFPWAPGTSSTEQRVAAPGATLTPRLYRLAMYAGDWLRCRHMPPCGRQQLLHVLTNSSLLAHGQSLKHITHPWLPQCILGWSQQNEARQGGRLSTITR